MAKSAKEVSTQNKQKDEPFKIENIVAYGFVELISSPIIVLVRHVHGIDAWNTSQSHLNCFSCVLVASIL